MTAEAPVDSDALLGALAAALLQLHKPYYEVNGKPVSFTALVTDPDDVPSDHVCRIGVSDSCSGEEHYVWACVECRQVDPESDAGAFLLWPCPTALLVQRYTDGQGGAA